jgi:hypothetical protein
VNSKFFNGECIGNGEDAGFKYPCRQVSLTQDHVQEILRRERERVIGVPLPSVLPSVLPLVATLVIYELTVDSSIAVRIKAIVVLRAWSSRDRRTRMVLRIVLRRAASGKSFRWRARSATESCKG